jgi:AAA family ATP:ADP antiporter
LNLSFFIIHHVHNSVDNLLARCIYRPIRSDKIFGIRHCLFLERTNELTLGLDGTEKTRDTMFTESDAAARTPMNNDVNDSDESDVTLDFDDTDTDGLLGGQRIELEENEELEVRPDAWMRPYWLGLGLFLILFAFWILDSLKEPIFALLVDGDIEKHQPPAKLCSVVTTLALVCFLELVSHPRTSADVVPQEYVLSGGGHWNRMKVGKEAAPKREDSVRASLFLYLGVCYSLVFLLIAYVIGYHPGFSPKESPELSSSSKLLWRLMAYVTFAMIESFGSLTVATFWSYTNSTLELHDAERYYGLIIACAQIGAIGGSTMVTKDRWSTNTLVVVVCMVILLMTVVMTSYDRRFPASSFGKPASSHASSSAVPNSAWSGIYLILQHNYVLWILGVSCLYEVALTCLDYQMKLLGFSHFEGPGGISFAQFLGRFGQITNILSLLVSSIIFPYVIRRAGLRRTLLIFPTLLVVATFVAYTAIPGNLTVLFVSMSILKAMTYSMHDPAKELLYMPTSNSIKFRAKFWIDVVGERVAKAIGSSINTLAGSVARSVSFTSWPSILSALALWYFCYRVGLEFEKLVRTGKVVGEGVEDQSHSQGFYRPITCADDDVTIVFEPFNPRLVDELDHGRRVEMLSLCQPQSA